MQNIFESFINTYLVTETNPQIKNAAMGGAVYTFFLLQEPLQEYF